MKSPQDRVRASNNVQQARMIDAIVARGGYGTALTAAGGFSGYVLPDAIMNKLNIQRTDWDPANMDGSGFDARERAYDPRARNVDSAQEN